jgi:phosphate-selective porin OprO/OprP
MLSFKYFLMIISLIALNYSSPSFSQDLLPEKVDLTFKDGLSFKHENDFFMRMRFRIQSRFSALTEDADPGALEKTEFTVRRTRLRFDGYLYNPNILYRLQLSFTRADQDWDNSQVPNVLRDAVLGYRWHPQHTLWFGMAKLPGNRQRVISSGAQQFVDRSQLNALFNIDRDMGVQHYSQFGENRSLWLKLALSNGEGRNQQNPNSSLATTARIEWYPLGLFNDDGDNFEADLFREPEARLGIAAGTSANRRTSRTGGQLGKSFAIDVTRSMETHFIDFIFKKRGFSLSGEYAKRSSASPLVTSSLFVNEGEAFNLQAGYLDQNNVETAFRLTTVNATQDVEAKLPDQRLYTLGISKYINQHVFKIQSDLTFNEQFANAALSYKSFWEWRFQVEFGI